MLNNAINVTPKKGYGSKVKTPKKKEGSTSSSSSKVKTPKKKEGSSSSSSSSSKVKTPKKKEGSSSGLSSKIKTPKKKEGSTSSSRSGSKIKTPKKKEGSSSGLSSSSKVKTPKKKEGSSSGLSSKVKTPKKKEGSTSSSKVKTPKNKKEYNLSIHKGGTPPPVLPFRQFLQMIGKTLNNYRTILDKIKPDEGREIVTITITGHGSKCKKLNELQTFGLDFGKNENFKYTTWTPFGEKDQSKILAYKNKIIGTANESDTLSTIRQRELLAQTNTENYFKIAKNYISINNDFFKNAQGEKLKKKIAHFYHYCDLINQQEQSYVLKDPYEKFIQDVLELTHIKQIYTKDETGGFGIANLKLHPDERSPMLTSITISFIYGNQINIFDIPLYDVFCYIHFCFYYENGDGDNLYPKYLPEPEKFYKKNKNFKLSLRYGISTEVIIIYIKQICFDISQELGFTNNILDDHIIDLHQHSCYNNVNRKELENQLNTLEIPKPKQKLKELPSLEHLTKKDKFLRKTGDIRLKVCPDLFEILLNNFTNEIFNIKTEILKEYIFKKSTGIRTTSSFKSRGTGRKGPRRNLNKSVPNRSFRNYEGRPKYTRIPRESLPIKKKITKNKYDF